MSTTKYTGLEVAIIGMSGRFSGSDNIAGFWEKIRQGKDAMHVFTDEELIANGVNADVFRSPNYVRSQMVMDGKHFFDAGFFNYSPAEAAIMNPQTRAMHECVWEAIEDSGNYEQMQQVPVGLFSGASENLDWEVYSKFLNTNEDIGSFRAKFLYSVRYMNAMVSYNLGLNGPSMFIDTACSSSMVAVHKACRSLLTGDSKIAIAGGVALIPRKDQGYVYDENDIFSNDGHIKAFIQGSTGIVRGEGAAFVVLKKLQDAVKDGDRIYAVIKGSAINNDGKRKVGFTAPSIDGQAECIRIAQKMARVEPESISYVEAHGTGTKLGDAVEVAALRRVFDKAGKFSAALGTVKSNIGHLDSAAGVTGLIKTSLALHHKEIPPAVHSSEPIAELSWGNNGFYLNKELKAWQSSGETPLRAGVSCFGIGGTNVHVVLEEAPQAAGSAPESEYKLLTVSAKTENSLGGYLNSLQAFIAQRPGLNLSDLCYTLQLGRADLRYRKSIAFKSHEELLSAISTEKNSSNIVRSSNRSGAVVFMFAGLGSQYLNMCQGLYQSEPVFRQEADRCFEAIQRVSGIDIKNILYSGSAADVQQTELSQFILFSVEYALARLLMSFGITPSAMIGYSFGEYTAACIAGVFSIDDAVKIIHKRGVLISRMPAGAMLSVPLPKEEVGAMLGSDLSLAIDNGRSCVVSGTKEAIALLEKQLNGNKLLTMRLPAERAMHSGMMDPALQEFTEFIRSIALHEPSLPYISGVTGSWITAAEATSPEYWAKHLRNTVRFADGLSTLSETERIYLEIGPGSDLTALVNQESRSNRQAINFIRAAGNEVADEKYLLNRLGLLWSLGVNMQWEDLYAGTARKKISLPTYCFEKTSYSATVDLFNNHLIKGLSLNGAGQRALKDCIYYPVWKSIHTDKQEQTTDHNRHYLLFSANSDMSRMLSAELGRRGHTITEVSISDTAEKLSGNSYAINPANESDYIWLFNELQASELVITDIVHAWSIGIDPSEFKLSETNDALHRIYFSIEKLAKVLIRSGLSNRPRISLVTDSLHKVIGNEQLSYPSALALGLVNVLQQELMTSCRNIDLLLNETPAKAYQTLAEELCSTSGHRIVALRHNRRWIKDYEQRTESITVTGTPQLKADGLYIITGGLSNVGYVLSEHILKTAKARVIVMGRRQPDAGIQTRLATLRAISNTIEYMPCDVSDPQALAQAVYDIEKTGTISGIVHAAGVTDLRHFELIENATIENTFKLFAPKIEGLENIYQLFKNKPLDLVWITSSLAAVTGGITNAAYSAANLFMDHFIQAKAEELPNWTCMNFGGLRILADQSPNDNADYCQLFEWSLAQGQASLIASKEDLFARIKNAYAIAAQDTSAGENTPAGPVSRMERPNLPNVYVAPGTATEKQLAAMLEHLLGIDQIGTGDDFAELGGDSLKAIVWLRHIKSELNITLSVQDVLSKRNVKEIATTIDDINAILNKETKTSKIVI